MIVVFGSISVDFRVGVPRMPGPTETASLREGSMEAGGKGANQAVAAARDGARVALAGAVGNDALAAPALAGLIGGGIDISRVREAHRHTGFSCIVGDETGARRVAVAANANRLARGEQIEDALLGPDNLLLTQTETDPDETSLLILRARRLGARVVLHFSPPAVLPAETMRAVDFLVLGETEATWLGHRLATGRNPASLHAALGVGIVCSRGPEGLEAVTQAGHWQLPPHRVTLVDTSGAGDVLAGVFAACLDRMMAMEPALQRANAAAALSCTRVNTQRNLPRATETDLFLRETRHAEVL